MCGPNEVDVVLAESVSLSAIPNRRHGVLGELFETQEAENVVHGAKPVLGQFFIDGRHL